MLRASSTVAITGVKAIVLWFPPERVALANGWYIMLGALGALSATGPAEAVVQALGWRGLFAALAVASAAVALTILLVVPERKSQTQTVAAPRIGFLAIYLDPRFLRIAPLAALGVGTSFSLQGLGTSVAAHVIQGAQLTEIRELAGLERSTRSFMPDRPAEIVPASLALSRSHHLLQGREPW
jgi:predicted MFS family arabinose efflux permease